MGMGALERLERSPAAKAALALAVFCLIVGSWTAYRHYRESSVTLPGKRANAGPCALWFVGSSSIHRWSSLDKDMAPWVALNHGIDNAAYADILPRFANSAKEAKPAAIILYAGENDIARELPVRATVRNLAQFLELRSEVMGDVPVLVLSMKPSPGRWSNFKAQQLFNAAAQRLTPRMREAYYVDITTPLLTNGRTGDNYRGDGVHMNPAGYRIWANAVRKRLHEILPAAKLQLCERARRG